MPAQAKNVQTVQINDFSPGIVQYGVGALPVSYSTSSPLGSASFAARCINRPGIGLVPFLAYTAAFGDVVPTGNSPAGHPWVSSVQVGLGSIGGIGIGTVAAVISGGNTFPGLQNLVADLVVSAKFAFDSSGNGYAGVTRFYSTNGTSFNATDIAFTQQTLHNLPCGVSFDTTAQSPPSTTLGSMIVMGFPNANGVYFTPTQLTNTTATNLQTPPAQNSQLACIAASNRVGYLFSSGFYINQVTDTIMCQNDDYIQWTDPPGFFGGPALTGNVYASYSLEDSSGFGAWGSVSTGELVLIRRGQGAVIVYGDAANPSSVVKLPAVQGTGQVMQLMSQCSAGAVYVTETNGVWTWNGGNTSQKISSQIPDAAVLRTDLQPGGFNSSGFVGCRTWHSCLNNLVFFPNNWVYDATNNSWWQCEDPATLKFGAFVRGRTTSRFMYGIEGTSSNTTTYQCKSFDTTTLASSYKWTSNPIPSVAGSVSVLTAVELVASNPSATTCTVTVTPTIPAGQVSSFTNNPQSAPFTIPATTAGYRAVLPLGFSEYNICISVTAANTNGSNPAPIIHAINLTFTTDETAKIT